MKYLILGSGWIANRLKNYLGEDTRIYAERFYSGLVLGHIFEDYDVMINTIAKTDIDWCEKNKNETLEINALLAKSLAIRVREDNKKYVFFSSACIFESKDETDWKNENDIPNPQCWYSWTKAVAEQLILEGNPNALIIRPRLPISEIPHKRNTLNKLLNYEEINTNQESVTIIDDMLPVLEDLIKKNAEGIYHLVNEGTISPAEIAKELGHKFQEVKKEEQDERLKKEGRAKRVTAYIKSTKVPFLPHIRERIKPLIKNFNERIK